MLGIGAAVLVLGLFVYMLVKGQWHHDDQTTKNEVELDTTKRKNAQDLDRTKTRDHDKEDLTDAFMTTKEDEADGKLTQKETKKYEQEEEEEKAKGNTWDKASHAWVNEAKMENEKQKTAIDQTKLTQAKMELQGQQLIKGLTSACEAYINGKLFELPPEMSELDSEEGKKYAAQMTMKYAQFMSPPAGYAGKKTWPPLKNVTCGKPDVGALSVPLICGEAANPEPFNHDAYTRLKRCVGPWEKDTSGHYESACSRASNNSLLYYGDNCEHETVTWRMRNAMQLRPI